MTDFRFALLARDGGARLGRVSTAHGEVRTPAFMPVGTVATVKALYPEQVRAAGADIVLGNTYHLMLRPGSERVARLGGLSTFMRWGGPTLTDSGGFQIMSLKGIRQITEEGATFASHLDGSRHHLTPERSIAIQTDLNSDIKMQLDECIELPAPESEVERAMELSLRWAGRSWAEFLRLRQEGRIPEGQAMFGIVQGGISPALRRRSAEGLARLELPGYALGGLAVGEEQSAMLDTIEATLPHLPPDRPRYLMGVGTPTDLIESVRRGIDMFDCVMPTRSGRHGQAFTWAGRVNLKNAHHADDPRPLDERSTCPAARDYSRAYLHHLIRSGEYLGAMMLSFINTWFYQELMQGLRAAIAEGRLEAFASEHSGRLDRPEPR